jgi:hypothetical protein
MSTTRERELEGGVAIGRLNLSLSDATFAEFERAFLEYERRRLQSARSEGERLEVRRRVAENILSGAFGRRCSWKDFNRALQRIQRLGYTDVITRCEVAAQFALSTGTFPEQANRARTMLDDAERRLKCIRKDNGLRKEWMREIRRIRRMTGWQPSSTASPRRAPSRH